MRMHAIQTGTVAIKTRQMSGRGHGPLRLVNTLLDATWTEPLPIYAWVIEHPEGLIVVDTGDTAHTSESGYFPWWHPYYKLVGQLPSPMALGYSAVVANRTNASRKRIRRCCS